jgi:hypothetical protein
MDYFIGLVFADPSQRLTFGYTDKYEILEQ